MTRVLKVLIVDDSPTTRQLMVHMINNTADMRVIAEAQSGRQAVQMAENLRPDVILMDIVMPGLNGLDATREIMSATPTPIVMVTSSLDNRETDMGFQALRLGALSVLRKPVGLKHPEYEPQCAALVNIVRAMAGVRVIHHRKQNTVEPDLTLSIDAPKKQAEIVAIVSSTGGPAALGEVFKGLPDAFSLPVVVVQHISSEFLPSLVDWLGTTTSRKIEIAQVGGQPLPGHIYFAPGDAHLRLSKTRRFVLDRQTTAAYIPSGDILLDSVASCYGSSAIGVILTGMGSDGAHGLRMMHRAGAYTIAQDETTSVVFGMPQEAIALGAAGTVLPIHAIAQAMVEFQESRVTR